MSQFDSTNSPRRDFGFVGPYNAAERAEMDRGVASAIEAEEKLYAVCHELAKAKLEMGVPADEIRAELMEGFSDGFADMGDYLQERAVANLQNAIEDALVGRPSRYPKLSEEIQRDVGRTPSGPRRRRKGRPRRDR